MIASAAAQLCSRYLSEVLAELGQQMPALRAELAGVDLYVKHQLDEVDRSRGATEDLRGYYWGWSRMPAEDGGDGTGSSCPDMLERMPGEGGPQVIVLFAQNIEPLCKEEVAKVFFHELGHLVGFDEWELVEGLGLG